MRDICIEEARRLTGSSVAPRTLNIVKWGPVEVKKGFFKKRQTAMAKTSEIVLSGWRMDRRIRRRQVIQVGSGPTLNAQEVEEFEELWVDTNLALWLNRVSMGNVVINGPFEESPSDPPTPPTDGELLNWSYQWVPFRQRVELPFLEEIYFTLPSDPKEAKAWHP